MPGGYRQTKETKCGEKGGETSERLVVPLKQGNRFRLDPAEGRRRRVTDLLGGNMPSASELDYVSTKQRLPQGASQEPFRDGVNDLIFQRHQQDARPRFL